MAGEPAPLASVKAAVMKSAAGAAAQAPASMAVPMHQQAISQDLSVMADQAKGYTQGVNKGNAEAMANRQAQQGRLAQEAAQAAQQRSNSLELQRMDLEGRKARMAQESTSAQLGLIEEKDAAEAEDEAAKYGQRKDAVIGFALRNRGTAFVGDLDKVVSNSGTYREAVSLLDRLEQDGELEVGDVPAMKAYLNQIYRRAAVGKAPNLNELGSVRKTGSWLDKLGF